MSDRFTVDPEALARVVAQIRSNAEEYDGIATRLLQTATNMGNAYDSEDNRAFVSQIEGCSNDLKAMVAKLNLIAGIVDTQRNNYVTVTEHNASEVRKLQN